MISDGLTFRPAKKNSDRDNGPFFRVKNPMLQNIKANKKMARMIAFCATFRSHIKSHTIDANYHFLKLKSSHMVVPVGGAFDWGKAQ